jgi:hypothetical protein
MSVRSHTYCRRASALGLSIAVICLLGGCGGGDAEPEVPDGPEDPPVEETVVGARPVEEEDVTDAEASVAPLREATVEIYFPSSLQNGLIGEFREIFDTATPGDRAKQIVNDVIGGPTTTDALRALPPGTRLRQVYVLENGNAYLDFTSELTTGIAGGSMSELLAVYSIVDSVVLNVSAIKRVAIMINGRAVETLNGHLDLRRPLPPNMSLILGSIVVENRGPGSKTLSASILPSGARE